MSQITLRQVPKKLDTLIRQISKQENKSINKTIIGLLEKALGIKDAPDKKRDLSKLAGTWDKSRTQEFEKNTEVFNQIEKEIWE